MEWFGGRPHPVPSPVQIIGILIFLLLFLLSYFVFLRSEFGQKSSFFAFCYMIALFALSVLLAWFIVKAYLHVKRRLRPNQER